MESEGNEATVSGNSLSRMASARSGLKSLISSVRIEMAGATENESSLSLFVSDQTGGSLSSENESSSSLCLLDSVPACFVHVVNPADVGISTSSSHSFSDRTFEELLVLDLLHYKYLSLEPTLALSF